MDSNIVNEEKEIIISKNNKDGIKIQFDETQVHILSNNHRFKGLGKPVHYQEDLILRVHREHYDLLCVVHIYIKPLVIQLCGLDHNIDPSSKWKLGI